MSAVAAAGPSPWRTRQLVVLGSGNALAGALLVIAWYGAANSAEVNPQVGWINVGIAAVVVAAAE